MKTAIIIHGMPDKEEYELIPEQSQLHWLPWLQETLESQHIVTTVPDMPTPYAPVYKQWKDMFERSSIDENTILVGHSGGAGFLVRWLSEHEVKVGKVALVAPWIDPDGSDAEHMTDFFDFIIDPELVAKTDGITVFVSEDDEAPMIRTVEELEKHIYGLHVIRTDGKGHFTTGDGMTQFPELLDHIL